MNYKAIHPFPARMAPEIAFEVIKELPKNSLMLDPMMGSGTSLRIALTNNFNCIGTDIDPLAILIAKTSNTYIIKERVYVALNGIFERIQLEKHTIPKFWDDETERFAKFWFGRNQIKQLSILSKCVSELKQKDIKHLFQVAVSRTIITKDKGASLARDVSHAKPHRTRTVNDFDVFESFKKNVNFILQRILLCKPKGTLDIYKNDARRVDSVDDKSIDCIITSPPYLHAVDYFRGHRLSLIWMGYNLETLRQLRGQSIGLQKNPDSNDTALLKQVLKGVVQISDLPKTKLQHLNKYAYDCHSICTEFQRVLKRKRKATIVIADAYSSGVFINNTRLIKNAAKIGGLKLIHETERTIPANKRYLPPPEYITNSDLDKRMKTETVLTFIKP